jgi:hypothetical protein
MMDHGLPVEVGLRASVDDVVLYVSPGLCWFAAAKSLGLPDDFGFVIEGGEGADRWVSFRVASAEWLSWLRKNCLRNRDARSVAVIQGRMVSLKTAIDVYVPHLAGVDVELTDDYQPPALDGVTNARL